MSNITLKDQVLAHLESGTLQRFTVRYEHGFATFSAEYDSGREPNPNAVYICLWNCDFEATGGPIRGSLCATHEDVYREAMVDACEAMLGQITRIV